MKIRLITAMKTGTMVLASAMMFAGASAQSPDPASAHSTHPVTNSTPAGASPASPDPAQMQREILRLREQMRQLDQRMQASVAGGTQQGAGMKGQTNAAMAQTRPGKNMSGMRMMDDDMDDGMPGGQSTNTMGSSMPTKSGGCCMDEMMGMGSMGGMTSPAAMATPSALPGFPGQSHLYHIGATGFFLDHPEHITLSTQQQQALAKLKQQSLAKQGDFQRQIDGAEQELWQLTGADQPQLAAIEKKARDIEQLRANKRVAFIRSVGESAGLLTDEQRQQLTGMAPAQPATSAAPMSMPDPNQQTPSMDHM